MSQNPATTRLAQQLHQMLASAFPGIEVKIDPHSRWARPSVTFVWKGFSGLLPEERFQRLSSVIPSKFRQNEMRSFVWIELAPGESLDDLLKMPRSEDVAPRAGKILASLRQSGLKDQLTIDLGAGRKNSCQGDFRRTEASLKSQRFSDHAATEVKLALIGQGVYCDCQVLEFLSNDKARDAARRTSS